MSLSSLKTFTAAALCLLTLHSCYYSHPNRLDHWVAVNNDAIDSVNFQITHHYWKNFNFAAADTFSLHAYPGVRPDFSSIDDVPPYDASPQRVKRGTRLVVADVRTGVPGDTATVWLKVATEELAQGWVAEPVLLHHATPDEPLSRFIYRFSDGRTLIFLSLLGVSLCAVAVVALLRRRAVHSAAGLPPAWARGNAFPTFYPTFFGLCIAVAATLYGSIQHFVPATWVEFYFHPTLNPLSPGLPLILRFFLAMTWLVAVSAVALAFDLWRREPLGAFVEHCGLAVCAGIALYLIFTLTTPFYVGYVLLAAYLVWAAWRFVRRRPRYACGQCGAPMHHLGRCPRCGAIND